MLKHIVNNPYRILGVLSNSPLRERVANQNKLNAFAKVGKSVDFPNDFMGIIPTNPTRTEQSLSEINKAINLDIDQLKSALFWFIGGDPMDNIALKHLQTGNVEKAKEIFQRKETLASLINSGVLAFIEEDVTTGFSNISKVIHHSDYRAELLSTLGIANLVISEEELSELFITELLEEIPASSLLPVASNPDDKTIINSHALEEPIAAIDSAVSIAKAVKMEDAESNLEAGTKLMNSTKDALKQIQDIAGSSSPQYQMAADKIAKQVLQCGINYYNHAPDSDVESPRKAMVLQSYALSIAVGQLTKDRCKENYDILKQAVDNMPPAEVAYEARLVKEELKKFCQLPDKISHSVNLLNKTRGALQTIKRRLGVSNSFYLFLSTQVVDNALHNVIEEVNQAQSYLMAVFKAVKESGIDPSLLNYIGDEHSPAKIIDNKVKPVMREAWETIKIMDTFDMESNFKTTRYNPNKQTLKNMCENLNISTYTPPPHPHRSTTSTTPPRTSSSTDNKSNAGVVVIFFLLIISLIIFLCIMS